MFYTVDLKSTQTFIKSMILKHIMLKINYQKITLIHLRKNNKLSINQKLQWLATSLGLFNLRDKENSCFRIFIILLNAAKANNGLSSDEIAYQLGLSRGTVVHHLNKQMEAGLVVVQKNKYFLRMNNLKGLVKEVEKDIISTIDDLKSIAKEIDDQLGI